MVTNTIKTFLIDAKENLIENTPLKLFIGMHFIVMSGGLLILTALEMVPREVSEPLMAFGMIWVAIFMLSVYFWGKRHLNEKANQKIDIKEFIAFFFGIVSGSFVVVIVLLST